jgi:hypothetical protein
MKMLTDFPEFNEGEKWPVAEKEILKYLSVQFPVSESYFWFKNFVLLYNSDKLFHDFEYPQHSQLYRP